jgi:hypothetical protein
LFLGNVHQNIYFLNGGREAAHQRRILTVVYAATVSFGQLMNN